MSKTEERSLTVAPTESVGWDEIDNRKPNSPYRMHYVFSGGNFRCGMSPYRTNVSPRVVGLTRFFYHEARCRICERMLRETYKCTCSFGDPRPCNQHEDHCDMRNDDIENPHNMGKDKINHILTRYNE